MGWKEKYAYRKLHKKAAQQNRQPVLPHPDRLNSVLVIWQPSQERALQYLKEQFNQSHHTFNSFCVFEESHEPETENYFLTNKDLNWWGLPKPEKTAEFFSQHFDLLLNTALKQNLVLDYLTAHAQAGFKIGWSPDDPNYFDLNINIGEKQDALFLARQQIFYLQQLNKRTTT